jgi:lipopolysaccharide/colanic/teichoic acid biosynthesis glycosyltransferase
MGEISDSKIQQKVRYVPFVRNLKIRTTIGFILLVLSAILAGTILGKGRVEMIVLIITFAWILSVFLTDKYVHKYPQRYFTYLISSHLKAAILMALFLWLMGSIVGPMVAPLNVLWTGHIFFVLADFLASIPRQRDIPDKQFSVSDLLLDSEDVVDDRSFDSGYTNTDLSPIDTQTIVRQIQSDLDKTIVEFIEKNLPDLQVSNGDVLVLDDVTTTNHKSKSAPVGLLVGRTSLNDVHRLNMFLQFCVKRINMEGYFVVRYMPLENIVKNLKDRYTGLFYWAVVILHFIWYRAIPKIPWLDTLYFWRKISWLDTFILSITKRRNRALSKAEVWGRLSYYGMHVIAESRGDGEIYLIAQRVALPVQGKRPSFYPIVALEKVGLDGKIIRMHKIRTMFPFSEFLQKRIFEEHGLASTGKFANDFRLTGFGKFLRKFWLDEFPQIFDWLRGDVKLVGMRATSRHFLSLYPKELIDLYVQIKPGLIPPIFDESIDGFDQIVEVELTYLQRYWDQPFRTDVLYFFKTFTDIVFKGVRSK